MLSPGETRSRLSYDHSRISRRERDSILLLSCFETRSRLQKIISRGRARKNVADSRREFPGSRILADLWCRSTGRPELEGQLSVIVSQYRRLLSTCIVRAQAQCLISRVGVISPQAREAAQRREAVGRMERQLREDMRAKWMAGLRGPGSARGGRCHALL